MAREEEVLTRAMMERGTTCITVNWRKNIVFHIASNMTLV
jgi:hypothetical protein